MRAQEFLQEQTLGDGSKLIATVTDFWLWQVTPSVYAPVYEKDKADVHTPAKPLPPGVTKIYYVSKQTRSQYTSATHSSTTIELTPDQAVSQYPAYYKFLAVQGDELISLAGREDFPPSIIKKVAKLSGAQNAPSLDPRDIRNHVLYQGQVVAVNKNYAAHVQAPLADGSAVSKFPKSLFWTLGRPVWHNDKPWNTEWVISNGNLGEVKLLTQDSHIVRAVYHKEKAAAAIKCIRELMARESLTLGVDLPEPAPAVASGKKAQPGSNMHKMLAYVAEHPGCNRSDWYVRHLGNKGAGMPGWTSPTSPDGVAASMGWIKNEGGVSGYSLSITPIGKLVLAGLNKGLAIKHTKQI